MAKKDGETVALRAYRRIGAALPKGIAGYFARRLEVAGIREEPRVWLGMRTLLAFCVGSILMLAYLIKYNPIATPLTSAITIALIASGFGATAILIYLRLYFRIADRTTAVEKALPDFLLLTVSNLRSGLSPFEAFVSASRPEFGALHEEVRLAAAKAGGTASLEDALERIGRRFDSPVLSRTISLFTKGIRAGGRLTSLLESNAEEVRRIQDLRAELATSTRTYVIFLGFIIILVMPFLLSVSTQFLAVFISLQSQGAASGGTIPGNVPTFSGKVTITLGEMTMIAIATLAITSLLASSLLGMIMRGNALYGLKYFPIFVLASIAFFFAARTVVGSMLSAFGGP